MFIFRKPNFEEGGLIVMLVQMLLASECVSSYFGCLEDGGEMLCNRRKYIIPMANQKL
jgi:hypothetical protein